MSYHSDLSVEILKEHLTNPVNQLLYSRAADIYLSEVLKICLDLFSMTGTFLEKIERYCQTYVNRPKIFTAGVKPLQLRQIIRH